jgi:uncharacterized protein (TIGR03118 family)
VTRTDLVSDEPGAAVTDPTLVNAWGLAFNPMGIAWVSAAGSGISQVYNSSGNHVIPSVVIPTPSGKPAPSSPTGQAFNGDAGAFLGDRFIFVTQEGVIAGWQSGAAAAIRVDNSASGAVYKGVALGNVRLYAADFHNGRVDVFDVAYHSVQAGFQDPNLPAHFAPFNVAVVQQGLVLVSYALQDSAAKSDVKGAGNGVVDLYDANGNLLGRLLSAGELNSPWGMTMAPASFAAAPGRLLVGNFGDGFIHAYDVNFANRTATLAGMLRNSSGGPLSIDGLWALEFGPGTGGFAVNQLYFTAGPGGQAHGRFGHLTSVGTVSMPSTMGGTTTGGTTGGTTTGGYGGTTTGGGTTGTTTGGTTTGGTTTGGTTTGGTTTGGTTTGGTTGGTTTGGTTTGGTTTGGTTTGGYP